MIHKRDRQCFSLWRITTEIFVLLKVTKEEQLFQKDEHHDDAQYGADDGGVEDGAAVIHGVLGRVRLDLGEDLGKKRVGAEESYARQAGTKGAVCVETDAGAAQADQKDRDEFQTVDGEEGAQDRRQEDAEAEVIRKDCEDEPAEEELLDEDREKDSDQKEKQRAVEGVLLGRIVVKLARKRVIEPQLQVHEQIVCADGQQHGRDAHQKADEESAQSGISAPGAVFFDLIMLGNENVHQKEHEQAHERDHGVADEGCLLVEEPFFREVLPCVLQKIGQTECAEQYDPEVRDFRGEEERKDVLLQEPVHRKGCVSWCFFHHNAPDTGPK